MSYYRNSNSDLEAQGSSSRTTSRRGTSNAQRQSSSRPASSAFPSGLNRFFSRSTRVENPPIHFSEYSSPSIPDSHYFCGDFMLGAGMVLIQPSTNKVVLLYDTSQKYWFLPKGRKDIGESLEQAALREAYEESGYRAEFMPLYSPTNQPPSPDSPHPIFNTEPIFMTTMAWEPSRRRTGGEYFVFWYVGEISHDAIPEANTGMPDEQHYTTHLVDWNEAFEHLADNPKLSKIVLVAQKLFYNTCQAHIQLEEQARTRRRSRIRVPESEDVPRVSD